MAATTPGLSTPTARGFWKSLRGRKALSFYLFIAPWTLGFLAFILGPIVASLALRFTRYDIILPSSFPPSGWDWKTSGI